MRYVIRLDGAVVHDGGVVVAMVMATLLSDMTRPSHLTSVSSQAHTHKLLLPLSRRRRRKKEKRKKSSRTSKMLTVRAQHSYRPTSQKTNRTVPKSQTRRRGNRNNLRKDSVHHLGLTSPGKESHLNNQRQEGKQTKT